MGYEEGNEEEPEEPPEGQEEGELEGAAEESGHPLSASEGQADDIGPLEQRS